MNIALWIVQVLLAAAFLMAGGMKLTAPIDQLVANGMTFVEHMPAFLVRFIGLAEVAGAIGLLVPAATRILPRLTGFAGVGLATVMVLAIPTHLMLGEPGATVVNIVLGGLAAFVAWGRLGRYAVEARAELSPA